MKKRNIGIAAMAATIVAVAATACTKIDINLDPSDPVAIDEPAVGSYGLDLVLTGATDRFLMQGTAYSVPRFSGDTVWFLSAEGDTLSSTGVCTFGNATEVHVSTSANAVLLQGTVSIVASDLSNRLAPLDMELRLTLDDSTLYSHAYHMVAAEVSGTLRFSTDTTQIQFEHG